MKHFLFACILSICMNACSYGQDRSNTWGRPIVNRNTEIAFRKINTVLLAIDNLYVDTVDVNKLADNAIIELLEQLDPHSSFLTAEEVKEMNEPLQGNFDGIGIQFNMVTDTLYVVQVIPGGPSEKVGVLAGDKIIYVDDILIAGVKMRDKDVVSKLKGPKGTTVNIKILRRGDPGLLDFKIIRDKIPVFSIFANYMIDKKTGYIKIGRFAQTTTQEFKDALTKLQGQGMENLILDLQNNGGGILQAAVELSNEFLKQGSLIVYTEGLNHKREDFHSTSNGIFKNGRLVVLVDEFSASASEIFSGAVQDWDRGVIVGRRTFGKGMVQRPIPLPDGSMIRLTTAYYYTPTGRSIQKPFVRGDLKSYQRDLKERDNRGEFISADSIHFSDSLKYNTLTKNRIVYGGGGIMPDCFVAFDTTSIIYVGQTTTLYRELYFGGVIYRYTRNIIEENRSKYKQQYPAFESFRKNFTVTDNMINDMMEIYKKEKAEELKVEKYQLTEDQLKDLEKSKPWIFQEIKMKIVSEVYGENEYYLLWNSMLNTYQKAVEIISNEAEYNKYLSQNRK